MPQDPRILKLNNSNGPSMEFRETNVTLEELDQSIRQWVRIILSNIDPPAGIWERIKHRVQNKWPMGHSSDP